MNRLIDTMDFDELSTFIDYLASAEADLDEPEMRQELERLFAPAPHWSAGLSLVDNQTWVFCFVSDGSPKERRYAEWISEVLDDGYRGPEGLVWWHATPVDLDLRYTKEQGE